MNEALAQFFDRVLQILGVDIQEKREVFIRDFQKEIAVRAINRFNESLTKKEREKYLAFIEEHPNISEDDAAKALQQIRPGFDFVKLFQEETEKALKEYFDKAIGRASSAQKQQMREALEKLQVALV